MFVADCRGAGISGTAGAVDLCHGAACVGGSVANLWPDAYPSDDRPASTGEVQDVVRPALPVGRERLQGFGLAGAVEQNAAIV